MKKTGRKQFFLSQEEVSLLLFSMKHLLERASSLSCNDAHIACYKFTKMNVEQLSNKLQGQQK